MADLSTTELVAAAASGDQAAWGHLVARFDRLVWHVVRGYRLGGAASADVSQTVWLKLVENLDRIRDPERLAAWLATTARNEALRTKRAQQRTIPSEFELDVIDDTLGDPDDALVEDEQLRELVGAFEELTEDCQQLLRLLTTVPPLDYDTISELIERPKGSIGPTRARCLERLRRVLQRRSATNEPKGPER